MAMNTIDVRKMSANNSICFNIFLSWFITRSFFQHKDFHLCRADIKGDFRVQTASRDQESAPYGPLIEAADHCFLGDLRAAGVIQIKDQFDQVAFFKMMPVTGKKAAAAHGNIGYSDLFETAGRN
jgi:hypothetical protein